jgi:hypothetical protein
MMDLKSATFPDCLRLADVVLLPPLVRFGEMTCISFYVINFDGDMGGTLFYSITVLSSPLGLNLWPQFRTQHLVRSG